jgi:hypothetical protein
VFTGGLRIATTVDLEAQAAAERAVAAVAGRRGGPYGALAAVEPGSGAVRAMVGGRDWWGDARFGRVTLATRAGGGGRPSGSAFKTFALVAALERGIPPEAVFQAPDRLVVGRAGRRGPDWRVANYEGHGFGEATLRSATALSINTVYAGLLLRLGGGDADRGARAVVEAARMGWQAPQGGAQRGAGHRRGDAAGDGGGVRDPWPPGEDHADTWFVTWGRIRRDLAGGHLGPLHAPGPGRRAPRPVPAARHQPGRGDAGRAAGCLPNRFTPSVAVASVVYLRASAPTRPHPPRPTRPPPAEAGPGLALRPRPWRPPGPHRHPGPPVGQPPGLLTADHDHHPPGSSTTSHAER